ncbi:MULTISPECIES: glycosyltransferase [Rhodonellum]|nr:MULTISPECIES: glycosyltransferase [Rhodonellum]SDZ32646.1 Glycosyltransferase involved in cell wall bisynthesis [Rhodonellum ikkaensis]
MKKTILCISMTPWKGDYLKSTVELMKGISSEYDVWFVDYPFTVKDVLTGMRKPNSMIPWKKIMGIENRIESFDNGTKEDKVNIFTAPPIIPSFWANNDQTFERLNKINYRIILRSVLKTMKGQNSYPDAIITAFNPFTSVGIKEFFPNVPNIYYCYDEISAAPWLKKHGGKMERKLMEEVDACVFTSDHLAKIKGLETKINKVVKNGVDIKVFAPFVKKELTSNSPKTIGYVGTIDDRFDTVLIKSVVEKMPNCHFLMVGRVLDQTVVEQLEGFPNVMFKPAVAITEVPGIMQTLDIAIIPYVKNKFTISIYPLKINEYLAIGLPVIMTSFSDLPEFEDLVKIADRPDTFVAAIEELLEKDSPALIEKRQAFAAENSWQKKASELISILRQFTD